MNKKGSMGLIAIIFLLLAISLITGCSLIKKEQPENTTALDECEKDKKGFEVLYESEKNRECKTETITIYKNITQNCTKMTNKNCIKAINESQINNSYLIKLIQQAQYWEALAEECHFYNESERNINLTEELEVCEEKLEDIEDVIG